MVSGRRGQDKRLGRSRLSRPTGRVRSASAPTPRRKAEAHGPVCSAGRTAGGVTIGAPSGETIGETTNETSGETIGETTDETTGPAWTAIETAGAPSS